MRTLRAKIASPPAPRPPEAACADAPELSCDLRRMFDDITREPMPQRLVDLCDKLEDAFRRGDLYSAPSKARRA